jgi:hypothetical protein
MTGGPPGLVWITSAPALAFVGVGVVALAEPFVALPGQR